MTENIVNITSLELTIERNLLISKHGFIVFYWKTFFARKFVASSLSSLIEAAKASTTCHEHEIKREKNMCTVGNDEIHKKPFAN